MTAVAILLALGVLFLAGEIFMPGLVLGGLGIAAFAGATVAAFLHFGPVAGGMTAFGSLALVGLTFWLEFVVFPRSRLARELSMTANSGRNQPPVADPATVVGRGCVALTTLAPSGYVEIDGRRFEALCRSGHVVAGERLMVVNADSFQLIVTQSIPNS